MKNNNDNAAFTRRIFLQQGVTMISAAATIPLFLQNSANAMMRPLGSLTTSLAGVPEDHILVVVQLGGGNDGLNTVIPYGDRNYYNSRPSLGIAAPGNGQQTALALNDVQGIGLHPAMAPFKELLDDGVASIIQGVGYPNPNRSHFTSMDIWHTADPDAGNGLGWIGRYFDNQCNGSPIPQGSVAIGRSAPLAMLGEVQKPVSFESPDLFKWLGNELHHSMKQPYDDINRSGQLPAMQSDSQQAFLQRTALDAQVASDKIRAAVAKAPLVPYPQTGLGRQMQMVGAMIRAEMPTRVYYVTMGGFDTHANQAGSHAALLTQFSGAVNAFQKDMKAQGNSKHVLTMVFSEFGRRVKQNASGGTDHGTAAPMYLIGDMVKPGLLGNHPSLTDLDSGDLKFNVDFRSIYAGILEDWMKAPSKEILGQAFRKAEIIL
ncbi:MAG: DUF1501 domain-containing protein [Phycisphaerales bacterium]